MQVSRENHEVQKTIHLFEKRIEQMHQDFNRYYNGLESKMPDWEGLEKALILFSRKRISDTILSKNLDRILFKFQNRKKIWLKWVEEYHKSVKR